MSAQDRKTSCVKLKAAPVDYWCQAQLKRTARLKTPLIFNERDLFIQRRHLRRMFRSILVLAVLELIFKKKKDDSSKCRLTSQLCLYVNAHDSDLSNSIIVTLGLKLSFRRIIAHSCFSIPINLDC